MQAARVAIGLEPGTLEPIQSLKGCFRDISEDQTFTFMEAIQDIEEAKMIPNLMSMAKDTHQIAVDAKKWGKCKHDRLEADAIASLMKYSAEDTTPAIYQDMNDKCYKKDRRLIKPYLKFMWLLLTSMRDIEPCSLPTIFRGVKRDLSSEYPSGREFVWHGFCSCTKSIEVLEKTQFCGSDGPRTIFVVKLTQGQARDITRYSLFGDDEDEILMPPGCRFKVESKMNAGHSLTIVQLEELPSTAWILDLRKTSKAARPLVWETTTCTKLGSSGRCTEKMFAPMDLTSYGYDAKVVARTPFSDAGVHVWTLGLEGMYDEYG
eukprot:TRINITY_DN62995_c0_g1_i1.p1 TRINITY_DN62995_c0_g1~~TRINITY_DN62995_c0_g1_i1.p1  ORF type:complete len:320 (+),score=56.53 TRINITY_DN62995_c0_g1_i1:219-1178(+)